MDQARGERLSDERRQDEVRARASQQRFKVETKTPEDARFALLREFGTRFRARCPPAVVKWLLKL